MLFSEPKIPQSHTKRVSTSVYGRFSALQRAENSSIEINSMTRFARFGVSVLFSEPKIPQYRQRRTVNRNCVSFSALQRAENSSIQLEAASGEEACRFQCSSASRKFLNENTLQQQRRRRIVSVLFSEPKIPQ